MSQAGNHCQSLYFIVRGDPKTASNLRAFIFRRKLPRKAPAMLTLMSTPSTTFQLMRPQSSRRRKNTILLKTYR
jgi:hypothetical protein